MDILKTKEHKDGSATITFEFTEEEVELFVEYAVLDILKNKVKNLTK